MKKKHKFPDVIVTHYADRQINALIVKYTVLMVVASYVARIKTMYCNVIKYGDFVWLTCFNSRHTQAIN